MISVVQRLLEQWNSLKLFFQSEVANEPKNELANLINDKLQNLFSKLYLQFLDFILPLITNLNKEMQSEKPKIFKLFNSVKTVYISILDLFIKKSVLRSKEYYNINVLNPQNFKQLEEIDLGGSVMAYLVQHDDIPPEELQKFRLTCLSFYQELRKQIKKRFSFERNEF